MVNAAMGITATGKAMTVEMQHDGTIAIVVAAPSTRFRGSSVTPTPQAGRPHAARLLPVLLARSHQSDRELPNGSAKATDLVLGSIIFGPGIYHSVYPGRCGGHRGNPGHSDPGLTVLTEAHRIAARILDTFFGLCGGWRHYPT
jgi:hypothetical protein